MIRALANGMSSTGMRRRLVRRGKLYVQFVLWLIETMRRGAMRGRSGDLIVHGGGADGAWRVLWAWAVFCDLKAIVDSGLWGV